MKALEDKKTYSRGVGFYIKLWGSLFKNTVHRSLEYRINFLVAHSLKFFYFFKLYFCPKYWWEKSSHFGLGTRRASFIFRFCIFIDALFMLMMHDNLAEFDSLIRQGTFDFHLLRPVNSLFLTAFRFPNAISVVNFVLSLCVIAYSFSLLTPLPSFLNIFLGLIYLALGFCW